MQTVYIGNTLVNDVYLGNKHMDDLTRNNGITTQNLVMSLNASNYTTGSGVWTDGSQNANNIVQIWNMIPNYKTTNGGVFDFPNNISSYMNTATPPPNFNVGSGDFTIDIWFTIDTFVTGVTSDDFCGIMGQSYYNTANGFGILVNRKSDGSALGQVKFYADGTDYTFTTNISPFTAGDWYNLQIYRSGTTLFGYWNTTSSFGNSLGTKTANNDFSNSNMITLGRGSATSYPLDGKIKFINIYNGALTENQRLLNYTYIKTKYSL